MLNVECSMLNEEAEPIQHSTFNIQHLRSKKQRRRVAGAANNTKVGGGARSRR
jgi:hypothetical protein